MPENIRRKWPQMNEVVSGLAGSATAPHSIYRSFANYLEVFDKVNRRNIYFALRTLEAVGLYLLRCQRFPSVHQFDAINVSHAIPSLKTNLEVATFT